MKQTKTANLSIVSRDKWFLFVAVFKDNAICVVLQG